MSQAGIVDIEGAHPQIPTSFVTNNGTAIPILNVLELLGTVVDAHGIPLQTTGSGNTVTIETQYASASASSAGTNAGVASFNSADFTVDANGYVTLSGSAAVETFAVDASTAPGTNPVSPNASGMVTVTGGQVAAGTTANVIRTDSLAANKYTIQIQRSQAVASSTIGDNGVSHFNSAYFTVDANGFVSLSGSAVGETITGTTGGALSPTAGNWNILGSSTAAGTTPVQTSGSVSTLTIQVQKSQAIASTNATNVGLAAFSSSQFAVDANGFVTLNGSGVGETITGNTGGALSPTAGNWNIVGTGSITTAGTGSTLTVELTGLTNHNVLVGAGSATITNVAPSATSGIPLVSNGSSSDPSFATATVPGGGTGDTSFTAYAPIVGGTTTTGALQSASTGMTNSGYVFTSTGASSIPTWQAIPGSSITINGDTGSITGGTLAFHAASTAGSTINFSGSGTTMSLNVTDSNQNTILGLSSGNSGISNIRNTAFGGATLQLLTSGQYNNAFGFGALANILTGSYNCGLGEYSGNAYTSSESSNIMINSLGVLGDSNILRIGAGTGSGIKQLVNAFICGIQGVTATGGSLVTVNSSDQLGVISDGTSGYVLTSNGAGTLPSFQVAAASSITLTADNSGTATGNNITVSGGTTGLTTTASSTTMDLTGTLNVGHGGTGATTLTGILTGNGTSAITASTVSQYGILTGGASNAVSSTVLTNGQLLIGSTGVAPAAATITATGAFVNVGAGTIQIAVTGGGLNWITNVGTSVSMAVNDGYFNTNASLCTLTLPSTSAVGVVVAVAGSGTGGWKIAQNSGNQIFFGSSTTTSGTSGYLASTSTHDTIHLVCVTTNANWQVLSAIGNITVN